MRAKQIIKDVNGYDYIVIQSSGDQIDSIDLCQNDAEVCSVLIERIHEEIEFIMYDTWDSLDQFKNEDPEYYDYLIDLDNDIYNMNIDALIDIWNNLFADHWAVEVIDARNLKIIAKRIGH